MRWLNPAAFVGAAALILPVLIHLFSRKQTRVVPFPSLRFVAPSQLLPTRRTQVSDVALLLVRIAMLAAAVVALAGPLWARSAESADSLTDHAAATSAIVDVRALVIDTATGHYDSVASYTLDTLVSRLRAESKSVMNAYSPAAFYAVPGAVDWLQQQHGLRELVVVSDFRSGTLDSTDLAAISRDIRVRLIRIPEANTTRARADSTANLMANSRANGSANLNTIGGAVVWWSSAPPDIQDAMRRAVIARGGGPLVRDSSPRTSVRPSHTIVVASPDADSTSTQLSRVSTLRSPWMGDVLAYLRRDTTLAVAMASVANIADTVFTAPFVVTSRSAQFAPLVAAAALPGANAGDTTAARLVLLVRTPPDAVATAAVLLAASHALTVSNDMAPADNVTASQAETAVSDEQLRHWEHAPSAPAVSVRSTLRSDYGTGPSDGRYVWILVLALVALESVMRRRNATVTQTASGVERA